MGDDDDDGRPGRPATRPAASHPSLWAALFTPAHHQQQDGSPSARSFIVSGVIVIVHPWRQPACDLAHAPYAPTVGRVVLDGGGTDPVR
jgi:hypothetical protein